MGSCEFLQSQNVVVMISRHWTGPLFSMAFLNLVVWIIAISLELWWPLSVVYFRLLDTVMLFGSRFIWPPVVAFHIITQSMGRVQPRFPAKRPLLKEEYQLSKWWLDQIQTWLLCKYHDLSLSSCWCYWGSLTFYPGHANT